tara:strand:- start:188 stop:484 length:297 start_codon:yes stop_codon:yes gene_type:complete
MTKDDIIRMAREAGAAFPSVGIWHRFDSPEELERFAKLVVANIDPKSFMSWQEGYEAGMETAAVICDNVAGKYQHAHNASSENIADECAGTIRARGTT